MPDSPASGTRQVPLLSIEADFIGHHGRFRENSSSSTSSTSSHQQQLLISPSSSASSSPGSGNLLTSFKKRDAKGNIIGLGTFEGVFVPTTASILGAVLFVRLSWAVGQVGWGGVLVTLGIGTFVNMMTALSIAAMSTNGIMKGGGAYFIISRSIGPELGVATGLIFALSLCFSSTFSIMAFSETFVDYFICDSEPCSHFHEDNQWLVCGVASVTLFVLLLALLIGGSVMFRISNVITGVMMASIILGMLSLLASHSQASLSSANFSENMWFNFTKSGKDGDQNFQSVFIIIFPMMTGITSGASMSGKLKNPAKSIGRGTIGAIGFTATLYILLILLFGLAFDRKTLHTNKKVFQDSCFFPPFIVLGVISCTLSSALGYVSNAANLLQALSRDRLLDIFLPLTQGAARDDEPQVALLCCWFLIQLCLLYGKLDPIASLVTDFFLLVYFFLNVACFALRVTGAPNFRPQFAYFTWHTALAGALSSLVLIFFTSPLQGLLAISVTIMFSYYVHITAPVVPWGDVSQALIYHQVRKYLLRLDVRRSHPKFWRPSILFVPQQRRAAPEQELTEMVSLLDFCNSLKKGGLYVVGNILLDKSKRSRNGITKEMPNLALSCSRLKQLWIDFFDETSAKAFHEEMVSPSMVIGFRSLLMSAGLGGLKPNTVVIQFLKTTTSDSGRSTPASPNLTSLSAYSNNNAVYDEASSAESHSLGHVNSFSTLSIRSGGVGADISGAIGGQYTSFKTERARDYLAEIQSIVSSFNDEEDSPESETQDEQDMIDYCEMIADALVLEKNLLIARHFKDLDKNMIVDYRKMRRRALRSRTSFFTSGKSFRFRFRASSDSTAAPDSPFVSEVSEGDYGEISDEPLATPLKPEDLYRFTTIDLWSTDERDWNDPSGTLALSIQLAFGLHRTDIWERAKLRILAACASPASTTEEARAGANKAYETLKKLLNAIRVEAEIVVLPSVGAALFEEHEVDQEEAYFSVDNDNGNDNIRYDENQRRVRKRCPVKQPLTQLEHCAELNAMVLEHSADRACVVFLPLPRPPTHSRITAKSATSYIQNLKVLTQGLPPVVLASPGTNISPLVTTEL